MTSVQTDQLVSLSNHYVKDIVNIKKEPKRKSKKHGKHPIFDSNSCLKSVVFPQTEFLNSPVTSPRKKIKLLPIIHKSTAVTS